MGKITFKYLVAYTAQLQLDLQTWVQTSLGFNLWARYPNRMQSDKGHYSRATW